jgi:hypothetical protein
MLTSIFTINFNNLRRFYLKYSNLKDRYRELKNPVTAILLFFILIYSCQPGDQSLGLNMIPGVGTLETRYYKDTLSISSFTYSDEKIRVNLPRYNILGSFNDPLFGYTSGYFAAQYRMTQYPNYESDATLDSVILQMSYKYVYGDTITPQTLLVHELSGELYYDNKYLSSYDIKKLAYPEVLGSKEFIPKFRTNASKSDTVSQILRIPLDPSLGNRLLKMDSLDMVSNDKFVTVFKGLLVETAPVSRKGSLLRVDSPSGVLVVYYHTAEHDSLGFGYYLSPNSADVSGYVHDYSATKFFANMNQDNEQDSLVFLQPTGGTKVFIKIPTLTAWKDSANYAINKATLTIHVDTLMSDYRRYEIPPNLYLMIINEDGQEEFPQDAQQSLVYYGGIYNSTYGTYTFSITQYLQQIIAGEKRNNGFLLVHPERNLSPKRVVLKGAKSSRPLELEIVYTRYK